MSEEMKAFLTIALGAIVTGAMELARGGDVQEAIAKSIESLETERAKEKFPNLVVDP